MEKILSRLKDGNQKKQIENIVIFIMLLLFCIIFIIYPLKKEQV